MSWPTAQPYQVELATAEWVDWYNNQRLYSTIRHVPPTEYRIDVPRSTPALRGGWSWQLR
ncbi:IS3 family transposase [Plantactinospora solaniradicis]|uniref:IS3 family transposase n=1 Tax=Plantactinospora solaniradicis TaxID=1723736 RepID=A0ABW1KDH7_9ACTN